MQLQQPLQRIRIQLLRPLLRHLIYPFISTYTIYTFFFHARLRSLLMLLLTKLNIDHVFSSIVSAASSARDADRHA